METKFNVGQKVWIFQRSASEFVTAYIEKIEVYLKPKIDDWGGILGKSDVIELLYKVGPFECREHEIFASREECARYYYDYYKKLFEPHLC